MNTKFSFSDVNYIQPSQPVKELWNAIFCFARDRWLLCRAGCVILPRLTRPKLETRLTPTLRKVKEEPGTRNREPGTGNQEPGTRSIDHSRLMSNEIVFFFKMLKSKDKLCFDFSKKQSFQLWFLKFCGFCWIFWILGKWISNFFSSFLAVRKWKLARKLRWKLKKEKSELSIHSESSQSSWEWSSKTRKKW